MWWTFFAVASAGDVLFVGNSYVLVGNLDAVTRQALDQAGDDGVAERLAANGFRWLDHVDRAETPGTPWETALVDPGSAWTWGILQEQSQTLGFDPSSPDRVASAEAAETLDGWLAARGGTVLMMTWGRRDGDPDNPTIYPDYATMQDRLAEGYLATRDALSTPDRPVWIAPVGLAWQRVHDAEPDAFLALYQADGSHPALGGTWLAACVIAATLTGADPRSFEAPPALDPALAAIVADAAASVVLEGNDGGRGLAYPWQLEDPPTTPADTGPAVDVAAAPEEGCGCGGGARIGAVAALAVVGAIRRRPRGAPAARSG